MVGYRLAFWLVFVGLSGLLGNYSYLYMERKVQRLPGSQPKSLKWPRDFWAVYGQYRGLTVTHRLPVWPLKAFVVSLVVIALFVLYVLLMPNPFGS